MCAHTTCLLLMFSSIGKRCKFKLLLLRSATEMVLSHFNFIWIHCIKIRVCIHVLKRTPCSIPLIKCVVLLEPTMIDLIHKNLNISLLSYDYYLLLWLIHQGQYYLRTMFRNLLYFDYWKLRVLVCNEQNQPKIINQIVFIVLSGNVQRIHFDIDYDVLFRLDCIIMRIILESLRMGFISMYRIISFGQYYSHFVHKRPC